MASTASTKAGQPDPTIAEKLTAIAPASALHYEESRKSGLLARPVLFRGRLAFDSSSGAFSKTVTEPRPAQLTLTGEALIARSSSGRERRLPISERPELAGLLAALRGLLSGDADALAAEFRMDYLQDETGDWLLQLRPRDPAVAAQLTLLEVRGVDNSLKQIDTVSGAGERQSLRIIEPPPESNTETSARPGAEQDESPDAPLPADKDENR